MRNIIKWLKALAPKPKAPENKLDIDLEEDVSISINLNGITQAQLDTVFKYGAPSNKLGKYESKPFVDLPYGVVRKDLITLQKKSLHAEAIKLILECQYPKVNLKGVSQNEIFSFLIWIRNERDKMNKRESVYLSTEPEADMIAAGVHRLDEMGALATIHILAGNNILNHKAIEELPYYKVYEVMKLDKINREIQKAYANIIKNKKH